MAMFFLLFSQSIPVKGYTRSVIADLQRGTFDLIPNALVDLLKMFSQQSIDDVKQNFDHQYDEIIDTYLSFLVKLEYGIFCDNLCDFPPLDISWQDRREITNCIIDFDSTTHHPMERIARELDDLGCTALELRFFCSLSLGDLGHILHHFHDSTIRSIDVLMPSHPDQPLDALLQLSAYQKRLRRLVVHSSTSSQRIYVSDCKAIFTTTDILVSENNCGHIQSSAFVVGTSSFLESQKFNNCLNQKISIDRRGQIRNCPSHNTSYGNIHTHFLRQALEHPSFRQFWKLSKDTIEVCKDCEFRFFCIDCRAYTADNNNIFAKPAKCNYNPYDGIWKEPAPVNREFKGHILNRTNATTGTREPVA